jgi:glycerol dehydrogenase
VSELPVSELPLNSLADRSDRRVYGCLNSLAQLILEGAPRATVEEVLGFSSEVGLPITLAEIELLKLTREQLDPIARRATAPGETIHNEPFEVTPEMVADAILAADAMGPAWRTRRGAE